VPYAVNV